MDAGETAVEGWRLSALGIESVRNLEAVRLDAGGETLVVTGRNGAGKTTVLESVYLLARGKTFRGAKAGPLVRYGSSRARIKGVFEKRGTTDRLAIAAERDERGLSVTTELSGQRIEPAAYWKEPVRVKLIGENAQVLLEGTPDLRRRFLDWSLFHVEPSYGSVHRRFRRVLAQRNAALRSGGPAARAWDETFVQHAVEVQDARDRFVEAWGRELRRLCEPYPFLEGCGLTYASGWPRDTDPRDALKKVADVERARGYTILGPGRADFAILRSGRRCNWSRGQGKVAVTVLQLAAERVQTQAGFGPSIFLLDDLEAELDRETAAEVWRSVAAVPGQIIATRVISRPDPGIFAEGRPVRTFHVEQSRRPD